MIGVFQVVDQLRQIFDRIDIMVGRRRNQTHPRRGVTHLSDPGIDLLAGQLTAFARLGALRHFDLQLLGVDQIVARHAEAGRGHLFDGAVLRISIRFQHVAGRVFAALAGIAASTDPVHRNRQGLVRLFADRAVGHRPGLEAFADRLDRLHFVNGNRLAGEVEV